MHQGSDPKVNTDAKKGHYYTGGTIGGIHAPPEKFENQVSHFD
jgi:hypothetical protein